MSDLCSWQSHWWSVIIGSGNGLVPNWHQAITWTNDDQNIIFHTASKSIIIYVIYYTWSYKILYLPFMKNHPLGSATMVSHFPWPWRHDRCHPYRMACWFALRNWTSEPWPWSCTGNVWNIGLWWYITDNHRHLDFFWESGIHFTVLYIIHATLCPYVSQSIKELFSKCSLSIVFNR